MTEPQPFKWHHFEADITLLCVRWYLRYALSYRDLEEMMRKRGLQVDHTTIYRSRAALCSRIGKALSSSPACHKRFLAC
jgi:transposase-like protein